MGSEMCIRDSVCTKVVVVKNQYAGMCTVGCLTHGPSNALKMLDATQVMEVLESDQMVGLGVQVSFLCYILLWHIRFTFLKVFQSDYLALTTLFKFK